MGSKVEYWQWRLEGNKPEKYLGIGLEITTWRYWIENCMY